MMQAALNFSQDYPPHQRHSATSRASAAATAPKFSTRMLSLLELFSVRGWEGITDQEGQSLTMLSGDSYRPLRVTLTKNGLIEDSGLTRKTEHGRFAVVWRISADGRVKIREVKNGQ